MPVPDTVIGCIRNLQNCISANYGSALKIKKKIKAGEKIAVDDFDLGMIIDRSYLHLEKSSENSKV